MSKRRSNKKPKVSKYLTTLDAADYLGISPRTLERWRMEGKPPSFFKFGGRVLYSPAVLDAYIQQSTHISTSSAIGI